MYWTMYVGPNVTGDSILLLSLVWSYIFNTG